MTFIIIIRKDLIKKDLQIKMQVLLRSFVTAFLRMTCCATKYEDLPTTADKEVVCLQ